MLKTVEKNMEVWRQLRRLITHSYLVAQVVYA